MQKRFFDPGGFLYIIFYGKTVSGARYDKAWNFIFTTKVAHRICIDEGIPCADDHTKHK